MRHQFQFRNSFPSLHKSLALLVMLAGLAACKKYLDVPAPPDKMDKLTAFQSDASATAAITGIYSEMINNTQQFTSGFGTLYMGLSADELLYYSPGLLDEFSTNEITVQSAANLSNYFWGKAYKYIYSANLALEQLEISTQLSPAAKSTLTGEARFCRAFCYFYLVNLFGDVPLVLSSDYRPNSNQARTESKQIYDQIIADLLASKTALPAAYPTAEKGRPNKWAATSLLARTYLYTGKWSQAEAEAGEVIGSGAYTLATLANSFLKTSTETIWQLIAGNPSVGTWEAFYVLPATASATPTYILHPRLLAAFVPGDGRKNAWVGTRTFAGQPVQYPNKYKLYPSGATVNEAYIVLRLAEQYLIRAEARAKQNNLTGAKDDLNLIRSRAGLSATTGNDQDTILLAIEKERQVELFAEWGHRWLDAKRTGRATALFSYKPTWQATDVLWPIPQDQINLNPALSQNPGY